MNTVKDIVLLVAEIALISGVIITAGLFFMKKGENK